MESYPTLTSGTTAPEEDAKSLCSVPSVFTLAALFAFHGLGDRRASSQRLPLYERPQSYLGQFT